MVAPARGLVWSWHLLGWHLAHRAPGVTASSPGGPGVISPCRGAHPAPRSQGEGKWLLLWVPLVAPRDPPAATGMSGPTPCLHRSHRGCTIPVGVLGLQTRGCFQGKGAQRKVLHHLLLCIEMLGYATREDGPWSSSTSRYEEKRQHFGGHPLGHCRAVRYKPTSVLLSRQGLSL